MATVTRTLTPEQAAAIRHFLLTSEYPNAAEKLAHAMPLEGHQAMVAAREPVVKLEAALTTIGMDEVLSESVDVEADEDDLRDWAVGTFDWARSDLGQSASDRRLRDDLEADQQAIAVMEAVMPLIDSLDATGIEAA